MGDKQMFVLAHPEARRRAAHAVQNAPEGYVVRVSPPSKTREQENLYHAMITDIASQAECFARWDEEDTKRLLVDAFALAMREAGTPLHHDGRVVPSLDGLRTVQLGIQTSKFWKAEASEFIEFLSAWGAENGIVFADEVTHA